MASDASLPSFEVVVEDVPRNTNDDDDDDNDDDDDDDSVVTAYLPTTDRAVEASGGVQEGVVRVTTTTRPGLWFS
ncbi:hypothetical protein O1611_g9166 [Lasiodiplodia mahajangana]|uniref:Uncharacterized protein n=1 Tax=Lasiodiplodia mahajangana TaxID=1108764 RepID=A0ACC2JAC7_9PEZI|nr:hypothetical protein O1611_g9166 [Lasiodiplodia mahajangana]